MAPCRAPSKLRAAGRVLAGLLGGCVASRAPQGKDGGTAGGWHRGTGQGSGGSFPGVSGGMHDLALPLARGEWSPPPSPLPAGCRQPSCLCRAGAAVMNPARRGEGARQPVYLRFMRAPSCPSRRFQFRLSVFPH